MSKFKTDDFLKDSEHLIFHFDVPGHHLKLETFIASAASAQKIVDAFNASLFSGQLGYQLVVLAPEEGSFLKTIAVWVSGGVVSVVAFLETDIGKSYFEGLTGELPSTWTKRLGESHGEIVDDVIDNLTDETDQPSANKVCAQLVTEMTRGMLLSERDILKKSGIENIGLFEAFEARGDFYTACINNNEVRGVGFTRSNDFPIPRSAFPERAILPTRPEEDEQQSQWFVSIESIYVNSPNWDRQDQSARNWKGKDSVRRDCYFVIDDEFFWAHVKEKDLRVDVLDNLKVQWAYQITNGRAKNRTVLRVLEFNGEVLVNPLNEKEIQQIVGDFNEAQPPTPQATLWD